MTPRARRQRCRTGGGSYINSHTIPREAYANSQFQLPALRESDGRGDESPWPKRALSALQGGGPGADRRGPADVFAGHRHAAGEAPGTNAALTAGDGPVERADPAAIQTAREAKRTGRKHFRRGSRRGFVRHGATQTRHAVEITDADRPGGKTIVVPAGANRARKRTRVPLRRRPDRDFGWSGGPDARDRTRTGQRL